ncbi:MAG: PAS domain-containing protein [Desulfobulbaceae bacterium]|nr:PAS domain-containing protein [Desulfobulbaceae bacterium]
MNDYRLADLLDLGIIQKMADAHYRAAGMPIGIIDAIDGSILVGAGWQDICVKFHRANQLSLERCRESDNYIKDRLVQGEACHYKCKNGLCDIGIPIVVAGRHLATLFLGQFFYEGDAPDRGFFTRQAHEFGFHVNDYLAALDRVPVFNREKVDYILEYDKALVDFIADLAEHALFKIKADEKIRENERKFHAVFDQANQLVGILSVDGRVLEANRTALQFAGIEEADVIGRPFWETPWWAHSPELQEKIRLAVQEAAKGALVQFEATHRAADGNLHYVDFSLKPAKDEAGRVIMLMPESRDISERKQSEADIKRQAEFLQVLIDAMPYPVFYKDRQGRYLDCNRAFERFYGISREQIAGKTVHEIAPKDLADVYHRADEALFAHPGMQTYEGAIQSADGIQHDVIFHKATFSGPDGALAGLVGAIVDITERKRAEKDHLANLRFFASMDRVNRAMQGANDLDQVLGDVLEEMLSIFDCDRAWLLYPCDPEGASWRVPMERTRPEYPGALEKGVELPMSPDVVNHMQTALAASGPVTFGPGTDQPLVGEVTERFQHKSQIFMTVYPKVDKPWLLGMHQCSHPRVWTQNEKRLFQEIGRRMSDTLNSLLMYRDLRRSEAKTRSILDNIGIGVALISPEMEILELNRRMHEWFPGIDPGQHPICYRAFNDPPRQEPCDYCPTSKTLQDGLVHEATTQTPQAGGTRNYRVVSSPVLNPSGQVTAAIEMVEDITERLSLESQLHQAQKMESVGRLAGGVAHDFNNMLGVIIGHAELALDGMDPTQPLFTRLQEILKAALRSADLTRQLLAFARKQTVAPKALDLNEAVEGMLKMLRRLIGEDINLVWLPDSDLWQIKIDPSQIDQILANLCVNARDAITGVGKVTIETHTVTFDEAYCADHAEFQPGDFVMLAVSDDGQGMDKETLDKIFEPFFTTKGIGKGTGLGLATVYGVVKQNNGFINVYSEPGQGSIFKIYLPRHASKTGQMRKESPAAPDAQGDETILLVEDEAAILRITRFMLENLGYRVLAASTPKEAIRLAKEHAGEINLLLTDVVMPDMNGRDLAKMLISLYPGLKSLFMSGYTSNVIAQQGVLDDGINFIQKPFSRQDLAAKVREALEGK